MRRRADELGANRALLSCLILASAFILFAQEAAGAQPSPGKLGDELKASTSSAPPSTRQPEVERVGADGKRGASKWQQEKEKKRLSESGSGEQLKASSFGECDYEKSLWGECQRNGVQQRTLKLKAGGAKCEPIKVISRECKIVAGCKYERGEWSPTCTNGERVRLDRLVSKIGRSTNENRTTSMSTMTGKDECKPMRKVYKDCRRACHYMKSAWSECSNGFKTRNLTLDVTPVIDSRFPKETLAPSADCVRHKKIRRECGQHLRHSGQTRQQPAKQQPAGGHQTKTGSGKLTAAQRRRLKLLARQQVGPFSINNQKQAIR